MNQSEALSTLMSCLGKSTNPLVLQLKQSAVSARVKLAVSLAKEQAAANDREKLAKLKYNGNEKTPETGDDLDSYDKCILQLAIEQEIKCIKWRDRS